MNGLNPHNVASARPGTTPWARASPRKVSPRNTIQVPTTEVATTERIPANSARCMNAGSNAAVNQLTTTPFHPGAPLHPTRGMCRRPAGHVKDLGYSSASLIRLAFVRTMST